MKNAVIVTAKGSNTTVQNKNVIPILGVPVFCYPIRAAKLSALADGVFVSTECPMIKSISRKEGVEIIDRPLELATPESQHKDVIRHAVLEVEKLHPEVENIIVLLGNTVMVTQGLIDRAFNLLENGDCDSCASAWKAQDDHPYRALKLSEDGYLQSFTGVTAGSNRQSYPTVYFYDQGVWGFKKHCALEQKGPSPWVWLGERCQLIERLWVTGRDIHTWIDVAASAWYLNSIQATISRITPMNEASSRQVPVAVVKSCKQYRFKIELPHELGKETRAAIRRDALREANAVFLNCSRNYQEIGWVGVANVSFADTKASPSDSKSEFIHSLICMRIIELSVARLRADGGLVEGAELILKVEARLTWSSRKLFGKLCENLGIRMVYEPAVPAGILRKPQIGGAYRPRREGSGAFTQQPIKRIEDMRAGALRRLSGRSFLKKCVHGVLTVFILLLWPVPIAARVIFSLIYQLIALPVLASLDGPRNVFVYFDLRLGKNRDIPSYLRWKFGNALAPHDVSGRSHIPFSHLARPSQAYSFSAMMWALKSLVRMRSNPLAGCVVVNYLIPPWLLFKVRFRRKALCRSKRRRLRALQREAPDFLSSCVYEEFIHSLEQSNAFSVEVSRCYKKFPST